MTLKTIALELVGLQEKKVYLSTGELRYHSRVAGIEYGEVGHAKRMLLVSSKPGRYISNGVTISRIE